MSSFDTRSDYAGANRFLPLVVLVVFILLDGLPPMSNLLVHIDLGLFLIPVFIIGLKTEKEFAPLGILTLGLLYDLLSQAPLGYWSVLFCLLFSIALVQRQMLQNAKWPSHWTSFVLSVGLTYLVGFVIAAARSDMVVDGSEYVISALLTAFCFPMIYYPIIWAQQGEVGFDGFGARD